MSEITIEPVTEARFDDAQIALSGGGDGHSCQCRWWQLTSAQWQGTTQEERREMLRAEVAAGPPPALVAYVDGAPAGWVRVGPRPTHPRLARTRAFAGHSRHAWDDPTVWAVDCFVVRREHRRTGLTAQLLDAAVEHARAAGARVIEAYPFDPAGGDHPPNELYRGLLSTFLAAGFREVARPKAELAIVERALGGSGG